MKYVILKGAKKRFLVTGGAGFIGSNLAVSLVENGQDVTVLDNFSTGLKKNVADIRAFVREKRAPKGSFVFIDGDIRDKKACRRAVKGADFVLHNAALGSVPRSIEDPATTTDVNVAGTVNMLVAAKDAGVKRFVYASSSSVYGDSETLPKKEGGEGRPLSPYAVSKLVCELYAANFESVYGLSTVGLRYFNVFGPRQDPHSQYAAVIPIFVKKLLEGKRPVINGDGSIVRDFTYVENVVEANIKAALAPREASGKVYNIACGGSVSLNELFAAMEEILKTGLKPVYGPERRGDITKSLADISLARRLLGYAPAVGFKKGLELSMDWYRENL